MHQRRKPDQKNKIPCTARLGNAGHDAPFFHDSPSFPTLPPFCDLRGKKRAQKIKNKKRFPSHSPACFSLYSLANTKPSSQTSLLHPARNDCHRAGPNQRRHTHTSTHACRQTENTSPYPPADHVRDQGPAPGRAHPHDPLRGQAQCPRWVSPPWPRPPPSPPPSSLPTL